MNGKTLILFLFTLAFLLFTSCIDSTLDSTVEPTGEEYKTLNKTLSVEDIDVLAAVKNGQEKVALCHSTNSETNMWVPIDVAEAALETHLAHGDALPFSQVEGQPDLYYNEDCEPMPDTTAPTCSYEIASDNSSLVFTAIDDLSGINSGSAFCSNCASLSLDIDGSLIASAAIVKADPNLDSQTGANFTDRAGNSVVCETVTF